MPSNNLATVHGFGLLGIQGYAVRIEAEVSFGVPHMTVVGLPDAIVSESRERVRCAMNSTGYRLEDARITVNMAPADVRKEGPLFDLPIALALLTAIHKLEPRTWSDTGAMGELSLDGQVRPVRGALPLAMACRQHGMRKLVLPADNAAEASLVEGLELWPVSSLRQAIDVLQASQPPPWTPPPPQDLAVDLEVPDLADLRGHGEPREVLEIVAAGGHNVLFIGPPGSGKTMLAHRLPGILPPLSPDEALGVMQVHSAAGLLQARDQRPLVRPFRAPHHSASPGGIVGGGSIPRPGEISLAHHGVLFFDELAEFPRSVLEVLREPLESCQVTLARAATTVTFPADFIFVACMNPCPCGNRTDPTRGCRCTQQARQRYRARISGPLIDRMDLIIEVPRQHEVATGEDSATVRARVAAVRDRQARRFAGTRTLCNARMSLRQMRQHCALDASTTALLSGLSQTRGLSARATDRVLRVARTIADLAGAERIRPDDILQAIQYRRGTDILTAVA